MNPLGVIALGGALWWLSRIGRNPYDPDAPIIGGIDGRSSAAMRRLANIAGYTRSVQAAARKDAEAKAAAAAAEVDERERYSPVVVPKTVYKKHDFFMRPNGDGSFTRVPMRGSRRPQEDGSSRYGLGERYQTTQTREFAARIAQVRTEANALRSEERRVKAAAKELGDTARRTYLDTIEYTVKELGGSRDKVAAFLPPDKRKWITQEVDQPGTYVGEDEDGFPVFSGSEKRVYRKRPVTFDPRTGTPVGLHSGEWGKALAEYLRVQERKWTKQHDQSLMQRDQYKREESTYYLDVLKNFEAVQQRAKSAAAAEEKILRDLAKRRQELDDQAQALEQQRLKAK